MGWRGLIPAHAGKTLRARVGWWACGAHPRSRGENRWLRPAVSRGAGSSPLTRGKRGLGDLAGRVARLIPAHAGKTSKSSAVVSRPWAHPRSRGENRSWRSCRPSQPGSSPLTRGKRQHRRQGRRARRLIPAHAGKTANRAPRYCTVTAHPRSRGENMVTAYNTRTGAGSSPLTRGKLHVKTAIGKRAGLIPAHAGKTFALPRPTCQVRAHPRSRGENDHSKYAVLEYGGSSPLTRGKRHHVQAMRRTHRLIPAHAGKTAS